MKKIDHIEKIDKDFFYEMKKHKMNRLKVRQKGLYLDISNSEVDRIETSEKK